MIYKYTDFLDEKDYELSYTELIKENPSREEGLDYIKTIIMENKEFDIYLDDYGQCYQLKFDDKIESCGTYNADYIDVIAYIVVKTKKSFVDTMLNIVEKEQKKVK